MINLRMLKLSDSLLWIAAGILIAIGFLAIFSTTYSLQIKLSADPLLFVKRQFFSLLLGLAGLTLFAYLDYNRLKKISPYFYILILLLLVWVLFGGVSRGAAQRWFQLGGISFQPSEFSKIVIILSLAVYFDKIRKISNFREFLTLLIIIALPFFLIFKQPDLGTSLVVLVIFAGMLFWSGASNRLLIYLVTPIISILLRPIFPIWIIYLLVLVLFLFFSRASWLDWLCVLGLNIGVGIALPFIWGILKEYQRLRILTFLNPGADPYGAGYHNLQSRIAIGSGGLFGKGFLRGTQTQLQFIPEQHSDFIFSAIGEEFGLLGAGIILLLYGLIVWRGVVVATQSINYFGNLLAGGIAVMFLFQVLANVGMTLGILPVAGMPLPFVSFGGSSLVTNLISVGILQSISMRRQKIIF